MPQPPIPPTLEKLRRSPHWKALEPIFQTGRDDARRGHWDNAHPARSLRWYSYEAGWDEGDSLNQRELASQRNFIGRVRADGGLAGVARTVEDALAIISQ